MFFFAAVVLRRNTGKKLLCHYYPSNSTTSLRGRHAGNFAGAFRLRPCRRWRATEERCVFFLRPRFALTSHLISFLIYSPLPALTIVSSASSSTDLHENASSSTDLHENGLPVVKLPTLLLQATLNANCVTNSSCREVHLSSGPFHPSWCESTCWPGSLII